MELARGTTTQEAPSGGDPGRRADATRMRAKRPDQTSPPRRWKEAVGSQPTMHEGLQHASNKRGTQPGEGEEAEIEKRGLVGAQPPANQCLDTRPPRPRQQRDTRPINARCQTRRIRKVDNNRPPPWPYELSEAMPPRGYPQGARWETQPPDWRHDRYLRRATQTNPNGM